MLRLSETEHILVWNAHHSVCDGWSVGLLVSDLMACYGELLQGKEPAARTGAGLMGIMRFGWTRSARRLNTNRTERIGSSNCRVFEVAPLPNAWQAIRATTEASYDPIDVVAAVADGSQSQLWRSGITRHFSTQCWQRLDFCCGRINRRPMWRWKLL